MTESDLLHRFATRTEWFEHGPLDLDILLPRAADELIDEAEFEADERLPYWADLWPSARALAHHLLDRPPPEQRILEVGCGVALPSLALLALGHEVLATDYYDDALRFAELNAARNGLPPLRTALLDWRRIPPDFGRFELVVVADVMYEKRNAEALADALPRLVAEGGRTLLADPGRVYLADFRTRIESAGWRTRNAGIREETSDPATGSVSRVVILEASRV
jgi:predicted nicotinamide N-methyase